MNRENIQKVRDHIAGLPRKRFNMSGWAVGPLQTLIAPTDLMHDCRTAACIGGWAVALCDPKSKVPFGPHTLEPATALLGLDGELAGDLFMPGDIGNWAGITNAHAVRVLDHLLATGEVDWKSTRRAKKATA